MEDDLNLGRLLKQVRILYEPSIEDPEVGGFCLIGGDIDLDRLLEPVEVMSELDMKDPMLECFAQFGYDLDFDELIEQAEADLDPILEMQPDCGETTERYHSPHHIH